MAQTHQRTKGRRMHPAMLLLLILVAGVAITGIAAVIGVRTGLISRGKATVLASEPDRTGMLLVPLAGTSIPAYTRITRDHLYDLEKMQRSEVWLPADRVAESGLITDGSLLGRVLSHDKMKGYAFSESDFFPEGTRSGPTGGIEPGMRGLRIPTDRVRGMHGLQLGDRFDLVAVQPIDASIKPSRTTVVRPGTTADSAVREAWSASTRILAQNGKVVQPVVARAEPGAGRKQVEEVLIAVAEHEVAGLMEALAVEAEILCLPRSGQPGADSAMPQPTAPRPQNLIEVFSGAGRSITVVPDAEPSRAMEGEDGR
jgi:hypothetical protein